MELAIVSDESLHGLGEVRAPLRRAHVGKIDPDETKLFRELMVVCEVVERGHDQTLGQITGSAENHHRAGRRRHGVRGLLLRFRSGGAIGPV
jgi:hypothetical protein